MEFLKIRKNDSSIDDLLSIFFKLNKSYTGTSLSYKLCTTSCYDNRNEKRLGKKYPPDLRII